MQSKRGEAPPERQLTVLCVNIILVVLDNEHSLMRPTNRGKDRTVERDETERVDRECSNRDGNGPLHDHQWTLVQNPRRAWK